MRGYYLPVGRRGVTLMEPAGCCCIYKMIITGSLFRQEKFLEFILHCPIEETEFS